jgi:predicted RNA-binding Zn-ribbon protein involved in translation (DUF1610 family)
MKCPDCGEEITTIVVERFQTKTFKVDHEAKEIVPIDPLIHKDEDWVFSDPYAYRCPNCDSLNINELLSKYKLKEQ